MFSDLMTNIRYQTWKLREKSKTKLLQFVDPYHGERIRELEGLLNNQQEEFNEKMKVQILPR